MGWIQSVAEVKARQRLIKSLRQTCSPAPAPDKPLGLNKKAKPKSRPDVTHEQRFKAGHSLTCAQLSAHPPQQHPRQQVPERRLTPHHHASPHWGSQLRSQRNQLTSWSYQAWRIWIQRKSEQLPTRSWREMSKACPKGCSEAGPGQRHTTMDEKHWVIIYSPHHSDEP